MVFASTFDMSSKCELQVQMLEGLTRDIVVRTEFVVYMRVAHVDVGIES